MAAQHNEPIAIIGSACRFPGGASSPARLWDLLHKPRDVLSDIPASRFDPKKFYHPNGDHHGTTNVDKAYLLAEDHCLFDASFFSINPREAEAMDPQQRILLETVYEGIESAGYALEKLQGSNTSVFVGLMTADYYDIQIRDLSAIPQYFATGTARSILSNRISYFFDWKGPSMTIDTACSSSLVAVHQAVQSLRNGESSMAIVAGANLILGPEMFVGESKLHMLSPTGRSRMWDAGVDGYARGEGFSAVMLKPLSQALRDGDHIESVIRETGVNQDGRSQGITMPSHIAQEALIRQTYARAGLDLRNPEDRCQYFEAHGTGTAAGDPVEAEAVYKAFFGEENTVSSDILHVGSIKTVIGHLEGTAGLAGLMKASLAVQNGTIPPNLHFKTLNPKIRPFYKNLKIPTSATPWPSLPTGAPRRVSVNSFGFGGTNAHAIIESFQGVKSTAKLNRAASTNLSILPLCLSANSDSSLLKMLQSYSEYLKSSPSIDLQDLTWSLLQRSALRSRISFSGSDTSAIQVLIDAKISELSSSKAGVGRAKLNGSEPFSILGVFTGQGAQYATMGSELIKSSPLFADSIRRLDQSLSELPDAPSWKLIDELQAEGKNSRIGEAAISQPVCTALQVGLVDLAREAGISFSAVIGHSSGEIGAAYAAGILTASDAIRVAYYRGLYAYLAQGPEGEKGGMIATGYAYHQAAVFCDQDQFEGRLFVAASNGPNSVTLSGDYDAVEEAKECLDAEGTFARILKVDTAYHSHHMEPCAESYLKALRLCRIRPQPPRKDCQWISTVQTSTEDRQQILESMKDTYWRDNMTGQVRFSQGIRQAVEALDSFHVAIEVGPHAALKGPTTQCFKDISSSLDIPYKGLLNRGDDDVLAFSSALGFLWENLGSSAIKVPTYRAAFFDNSVAAPRMLKGLPSYPWQHDSRYWKESRLSESYRSSQQSPHELLGSRTADDNEQQMRWRNLLQLKDLPWARGHVFQDQVLFPAAGYVSMALEASRAMAEGTSVSLIELTDLVIIKAMSLDDNSSGVETLATLSVEDGEASGTSEDTTTARFTLYACPPGAATKMVKHFTGRVLIHSGPASASVLPQRSEHAIPMGNVDVNRFYASMSEIDLDYTGMFRGITKLERRMDMSRATVSKDITTSKQSQLLVHPAFLDVCLQTLFAGFSAPGDDSLWTTYLPTTIGRIAFNPRQLENDQSAESWVDSSITKGSSFSIVGDVEVFDEAGNMVIQMQDLACNSFAKASPANDRKLFSKIVWKSDISNRAELTQFDSSKYVDEADIVETCERAAYFYLRNLRQTVTSDEERNLKWHFQKLLNFADFALPSILKGDFKSLSPGWQNDDEETIKSLVKRFPDVVDVQLVEAVGSNLVGIVREKTEALDVMRQNSMLDRFYSEGIGATRTNEHVLSLVRQIAHRYPHMKVLEIGAGMGGTTGSVLKGLGQSFSVYYYTDISSGFFDRARTIFSSHSEKMKFKKLDIENDTTAQGFENQSFDLIIASNVLHATRFLKKTMANVRALLRPGGYLLLGEITGDALRNSFIMSPLPGWWLGIEDGRKYSPLITEVQWDSILEDTGFSGIDIVKQDHDVSSQHMQSVMISQAVDDRVHALRDPLSWSHMIPQTERFVVVSGKTLGSTKISREIRRLLRPWSSRIENVDSFENLDMDAQGSGEMQVICLSDFDTPYFEQMTPRKLSVLQMAFEKSKNILWATRNCRADNPFSNAVVGLARTVQTEVPHLALQMLDFESGDLEMSPTQIARHMANAMLRLLMTSSASELTENILWTTERELLITEAENLMIPRVRADDELNDRLNSSRRPILMDIHPAISPIDLVYQNNAWLTRKSLKAIEPNAEEENVRIRVQHSLLQTVRVMADSYLFICLGEIVSSKEKVIALSKTNTSIISTPVSWTTSCKVSDAEAPSYLWAFACGLLSRNILDACSISSTTIVHEPDQFLEALLSHQARSDKLKVRFTTINTSRKHTSDSIIFHPAASTRDIKKRIPKDVSSVFDMDHSGKSITSIAKCVPHLFLHGTSWSFGLESMICPSFTVENLKSLMPSVATLLSSLDLQALPLTDGSVHNVASFATNNLSTASPSTIISWQTDTTVPVRVTSVNPNTLFSKEKTYLLIGLTGELGQSLSRWMVMNGAKYIVLASRNPQIPEQWHQEMNDLDATIKIVSVDLTSKESLYALHEEITSTLPPVGGVANGAMVLVDKVFADLSFEQMNTVIQPKITGTKYLDELYSSKDLDFFVLFSSLSSIVGNRGQSNYNAANTFMISTARNRRKRGLAASVMNIGMLIGLGYVSRTGASTERHLRKLGFMPISEREFHFMFAESIVGGKSDSVDDLEMITGLQPTTDSVENGDLPPWAENPLFAHMVTKGVVVEEKTDSKNSTAPVAEQLRDAESPSDAIDILQTMFLTRLGLMLQQMPDTINVNSPLTGLGIDSLIAVDIRSWFLKELKTDIPIFKILGGITVSEICDQTISNLPAQIKPRYLDPSASTAPTSKPNPAPRLAPTPLRAQMPTQASESSSSRMMSQFPTPPQALQSTPMPAKTVLPSPTLTPAILPVQHSLQIALNDVLLDEVSDSESDTNSQWSPQNSGVGPLTPDSPWETFGSKTGSKTPMSEISDVQDSFLPAKRDSFIEATIEKSSRMSAGQSTMWFLLNYLNDRSTYNLAIQYTLRGPIDIERFEEAIATVIHRHESLRTSFCKGLGLDSNEATQCVLSKSPFQMRYISADSDAMVQDEFEKLRNTNFNLSKGHALEVCLVRRSHEVHEMIFSTHHIVMDGVSWRIFLRDIHAAYKSQQLTPIKGQFIDFAKEERQMVAEGRFTSQLAYWKNEYQHLPEPLPLLPISKVAARHSMEVYDTKTVSLDLDSGVVSRIRQASKRLSTTPFQFYLSALQVFLYRLTEARDICIGIIDANRSNEKYIDTIGYFINTLAVRFEVDADTTFDKVVAKTRNKVYGAMANAQIPFDVLLDELKVPRSTSHSPLFQVLMNYRLGALEQTMLGDCEMTDAKTSVPMTPYDLTLLVAETSKGDCLLQFDMQQYLYAEEDSKQLLQSYAHLLDVLSREPLSSLNDCELYSSSMVQESLHLGKGPEMDLEPSKTLLHYIDFHASQQPTALAMKDSYGIAVSYEDMTQKLSAIASKIEIAIRPGSKVGLLCEPSVDAVCSMLAVMRLGAVCIPLDLSNPVERLRVITEECLPQIILFHDATRSISEQIKPTNSLLVNVSDIQTKSVSLKYLPVSSLLTMSSTTSNLMKNEAHPHLGALTLYTSGTTGRPKGVVLDHQCLTNCISATTKTLDLGKECILQQSSLGFDLSIAQIFLALANGGSLVITARDQRGDALELSKLMLQESVTFTFCVPSEYSILLRYGSKSLNKCKSWRIALSAGERMTSRIYMQFQEFAPHVSVYNGYGPAETTIVSHMAKMCQGNNYNDFGEEYHTVGKSLPNFSTYIMDKDGNPVPRGIAGEVYIGGASVSPGYSNNDELNTQKFLPNPYATPLERRLGWDRLYRSGDKGRLLSDGSLVPLGRIDGDNQIKLRGMRVELEGVENAILATAKGDLTDAVVIAKGEVKILVGFVTFASGFAPAKVEPYLQSLLDRLPLPHYMRPTQLVHLSSLPRTPNGKADRSALSKIHVARKSNTELVDNRPLNSTEVKLSTIWRKLLHDDEAAPLEILNTTDFFDVGGNSLLVVELQGEVHEVFNISLSLREFFHASSLQNMAAKISPDQDSTTSSIDWIEETAIQPRLLEMRPLTSSRTPSSTKRVLLTGAFGFLGKSILQRLVDDETVEEVHCIAIRGSSRESPVRSRKIMLYTGDLTHPQFGLSETDFVHLSGRITAIIHNGAEVSFMKSYQSLAKVNVEPTKQLYELSLLSGASIHYVSTGGIAGLLGPGKLLQEAYLPASVAPPEDGSYGYVASKWASEQYLANVEKQFGTEVWIHRPMYIVGEDAPATDVVNTILQYSVKTSLVPNLTQWHGSFDMVQVESVAQDVVQAVCGDAQKGALNVRHQCGEVVVPVEDLKAHLESQYDLRCQVAELSEWVKAAEKVGLPAVMVRYLEMLVGQEVHLPNVQKRAVLTPKVPAKPGTLKGRPVSRPASRNGRAF